MVNVVRVATVDEVCRAAAAEFVRVGSMVMGAPGWC